MDEAKGARLKGDGRIFKRKKSKKDGGAELPNYWVKFWGPKKSGEWGEIRESANTTNEKKALHHLRKRVQESRNHRDGIAVFQGRRQERLTVANLLDALFAYYEERQIKSMRNARVHEKPVREHFGHRRGLSVTPDDVRGYIAERRKRTKNFPDGRANATINRELEILGRAFSLAVQEERLSRKPYIPTLPEDNARKGFFEKHELDAILPYLPEPLDDMARFAFLSGWRAEEVRGLRWENVDRGAMEIRLDTSKNGEGRVLPLDEIDFALFEKLWAAREYRTREGGSGISAFVFHRQGRPVCEDTFGGQWRRARTKAKLPEKLFHDLRRTAARNMIRAGVPQTVAKSITGHKTDSMFNRYNISSSDDKRRALRLRRDYVATLDDKSNVREASFGKGGTEARTPEQESPKG
jgi:integrase